jgi:hypothetical protein
MGLFKAWLVAGGWLGEAAVLFFPGRPAGERIAWAPGPPRQIEKALDQPKGARRSSPANILV